MYIFCSNVYILWLYNLFISILFTSRINDPSFWFYLSHLRHAPLRWRRLHFFTCFMIFLDPYIHICIHIHIHMCMCYDIWYNQINLLWIIFRNVCSLSITSNATQCNVECFFNNHFGSGFNEVICFYVILYHKNDRTKNR